MKAIQHILGAILLLLAVGSGRALSAPVDHWSLLPSGTTNNLRGVVHGNGQFVSVGEGGIILSSFDGRDWRAHNSGTTNTLNGIAYGSGLFVAAGVQGTILTSSNGCDWRSIENEPARDFTAITYGADEFVALGSSYDLRDEYTNIVAVSAEGTNWTRYSVSTGSVLLGITFGNGLYAAVGDNGAILTSSAAQDWTRQDSPEHRTLRGVTHGQGLFVAVGGYFFDTRPSECPLITSPDGIHWEHRSSGTSRSMGAVTYGAGLFLAVGGYDVFADAHRSTILDSTDGYNWTRQILEPQKVLNGVAYGNGTFVAVGDEGVILQSGRVNAPLKRKPLAGGGGHTVALKVNGSLWAWGDNYYGQLGDGTMTPRDTPVRVAGCDWASVFAGQAYTLALKTDGRPLVLGWQLHRTVGQWKYRFQHQYAPARTGGK